MPRTYTYLILSDYVYVRVTGLIWCYNGLTNPNNIDKNAGDALEKIYQSIEIEKPFLIDCKGVSGITDHAWDILFQSIQLHKREVHFINTQNISQKIYSSKSEFCSGQKITHTDNSFSIYTNSIKYKLSDSINKEINNIILSNIKNMVSDSFFKYPNDEMHLLSSTPIYSNGEFDAAELVSNQKSFYWISLKLSDDVDEIIQKYRIGGMSYRTKILSVSLRSSPFAAAVSLLLGLQLETVDHFGPVFKNHEPNLINSDVKEYIYMGDFSVGGTEIKISRTYAHLKKAQLNHAIVIGSLLPQNCYKEFNLHSLVLLKDCNSEAKYSLEYN